MCSKRPVVKTCSTLYFSPQGYGAQYPPPRYILYIYIYTHTHTYIRTYTEYTHIHTYVHTQDPTRDIIFTHTHTHTYISTYTGRNTWQLSQDGSPAPKP